MSPRFGLFEHSESPPAPSVPLSSSAAGTLATGTGEVADPNGLLSSSITSLAPLSTNRPERQWRDPTERAFSRRYRVHGGASGSSDPSNGDVANRTSDNRGASMAEAGIDLGGDEAESDSEDEAKEMDEDAAFEAQQESQRITVEGASGAGAGDEGWRGGGVSDENASGSGAQANSKFLPTARPSGYSDSQLGR